MHPARIARVRWQRSAVGAPPYGVRMASRPDPSEQTDPLFELPSSSGSTASPAQSEPQEAQLPLFEALAAPPGAPERADRPQPEGHPEQAEASEQATDPAQASAHAPTSSEPGPHDPSAGPQDSSTPWNELPRAAFDLETTGKDAHECRIVTAALLLIDARGEIVQRRDWLADPGVEIPEGAAAVHGISTEHAREHGRPAAEAVPEIVAAVADLLERGIPVLAFNASYDFTVLAAEARRHGLHAPEAFPVLDPYVMHKHVRVRWRGKRTLVALSEAYGVDLEEAHTSAADALAAEQVARRLAEEFAELRMPAAQIHGQQIEWSAEQAADFQKFLRERRQDPSIVIDGTWPVRDQQG